MDHMRTPKQTFQYSPKNKIHWRSKRVGKLEPDPDPDPDPDDVLCPEFSITVSVVTKSLNVFYKF
jgi:hypothetical protein